MYKNKYGQRNNICGSKLISFRSQHQPRLSQRALADKMQLAGVDLDKNAIQRIESGERFVTDIELRTLAAVLHTTADALLEDPNPEEE